VKKPRKKPPVRLTTVCGWWLWRLKSRAVWGSLLSRRVTRHQVLITPWEKKWSALDDTYPIAFSLVTADLKGINYIVIAFVCWFLFLVSQQAGGVYLVYSPQIRSARDLFGWLLRNDPFLTTERKNVGESRFHGILSPWCTALDLIISMRSMKCAPPPTKVPKARPTEKRKRVGDQIKWAAGTQFKRAQWWRLSHAANIQVIITLPVLQIRMYNSRACKYPEELVWWHCRAS